MDTEYRYDNRPCGWDGWTEHANGDITWWTDAGERLTLTQSQLEG